MDIDEDGKILDSKLFDRVFNKIKTKCNYKGKKKVFEQTNLSEKQNFVEIFKQINKKSLEDDLFVYNSIKDIGLNRFTEKLGLYNNYAGNYLNEPNEENITKKHLDLQRFQIFEMKEKQQPFQIYLKKLKRNTFSKMERNHEISFLENNSSDGEKVEFKKSKFEKPNLYIIFIY